MRWFKYVWIVIVGILYILWTAVSIEELVDFYKTKDDRQRFIDIFIDAVIDGIFFGSWFTIHFLGISIGSFVIWIISITK